MELFLLQIKSSSARQKKRDETQFQSQLTKELIIRISVAMLLILAITDVLSCRLLLLIAAGFISGFYYGWYNDVIWNPSGNLESDPKYRGHQVWIHVFCGVVGSVTLWVLLERVNPWYFESYHLNGVEFFYL